MATGTLEADESLAAWAEMSAPEREAYANDLHKGVVEERAAEAARDKEKPAEPVEPPPPGRTRDETGRFTKQEETPANDDETPVVDDAAPAATPDKAKEDDRAWLDADTKDLANAMGLSDDDLADFGSKAELDRALRIIDKQAYKAAKEPPKPNGDAKPPAQPASVQQQRTDDALAKLEAFKLENELGADDAPKLNEAFAAVVAELKEQRAWRAETQKVEAQRSFQSLRAKAVESLHSLGHADLFGKPGEKPTKEQAANVEKALEAHFTHGRGLAARGGQPAPTPAFLKAAVNLAFGDQLIEKTKQEQLARLKKQSAKRTGGGSTTLPPLPKDATPLERNLREAQANWKKAHGEDV